MFVIATNAKKPTTPPARICKDCDLDGNRVRSIWIATSAMALNSRIGSILLKVSISLRLRQ